jgi:hypothetical protein
VLRGNREECANHGHGTVFRAANGGNQSSKSEHRRAGGGDHLSRCSLRTAAADRRGTSRWPRQARFTAADARTAPLDHIPTRGSEQVFMVDKRVGASRNDLALRS